MFGKKKCEKPFKKTIKNKRIYCENVECENSIGTSTKYAFKKSENKIEPKITKKAICRFKLEDHLNILE